jgi:hypothetical protein
MRVGRAAWVLDAKEWRERYGQIGTQTAARDSTVSRIWSISVTEAAEGAAGERSHVAERASRRSMLIRSQSGILKELRCAAWTEERILPTSPDDRERELRRIGPLRKATPGLRHGAHHGGRRSPLSARCRAPLPR